MYSQPNGNRNKIRFRRLEQKIAELMSLVLSCDNQLIPQIMPLQSAHCRSQCVLLKRICKKDFDLHLSKTTPFHVIQIAQQSADAAVNNNELYFLVATFDHLIKMSFMSLEGEIPKSIWRTRHRNLE